MSECSGPDCKHPSHKHEAVDATFSTMPRYVTEDGPKKRLTKNQIRARRKKGVRGY